MRFILLGAPGVGKGTQGNLLSRHYNIPKLSTGDILRAVIQEDTEFADEVKKIINKGELVPDYIVEQIVKERIYQADCLAGFILDGFPRTIHQAQTLDSMLGKLSKDNLFIINIQIDDEELIQRLTGRFNCKKCGRSYNKFVNNTTKPGICDTCGSEEFVYRDDDQYDAVKHRLMVYYEYTTPLLTYYKAKQGFININGNKAVQDVFSDIMKYL